MNGPERKPGKRQEKRPGKRQAIRPEKKLEKKPERRGGALPSLPFALKDIGKLDACPELVSCPVLKSRSDSKTKADLWLHLGWEGQAVPTARTLMSRPATSGMPWIPFTRQPVWGAPGFFCGSQAEYGIADGVMGEEILCRPVSEYGKDKLEVCRRAGEEAKALGIDYIHARIFSVYGPGRPSLVPGVYLPQYLS